MKNKRNIIIVFSLALILSFLPSCRNAVEEPAPFGPSSLSILLHTSANPNVLFAGSTPEVTTITASLKKFDGTPLSNISIHFEVIPNLGHFEGNQSVITKTTDSSGLASLSYYGPIAQDLTANQTLYIYAYAAWEGKEIIAELTPVYIVRDKYDLDLVFELMADPNVLWCTSERPESVITGFFAYADGTPVVGCKVFFEILSSGPGEFSNSKTITFAYTDNEGIASVTYIGPTRDEIDADQFVTIQGQPETSTPDSISEEIDIRLIREKYDPALTFELMADPNVLWCTSERPESLITGIFAYADGAPVVGRKVFFTILSGPGEFSDGKTKTYAVTDEEGVATITYIGPTNDEIDYDQFVTIRGQPETYWADPDNNEYYLHKEMQIRLIKGTN